MQRCGRQGCYLEGLTVRILHLKLAFENELVADDPADVHLLGDQNQAVRHLGSHLRIVILVVKFGIEVFFLHLQLAGVDGLADLTVMSLHMNEFVLLGNGLGCFFVQAGLLGGIHLLREQTAGKFLRLLRKTDTLRFLTEEHLRILCKRLLRTKETLFEKSVLGFQGLHPFLFFGSHFTCSFLCVKVRKNGHTCKSGAVFLQFILLIFRKFSDLPRRLPSGHSEGPSGVAAGASDRR